MQLEAWQRWHDAGAGMCASCTKWIEVANQGASSLGFADVGELRRSGHDMSPPDLVREVHRLRADVKPLYDDLRCYARGRLEARYGSAQMDLHGRIAAHLLLGNMWGQEWTNPYPLLAPHHGADSFDVTKRIAEKRLTPRPMVAVGAPFFNSHGFAPLPVSRWERSLLSRPRGREVVCHASAWDPTWSGAASLVPRACECRKVLRDTDGASISA